MPAQLCKEVIDSGAQAVQMAICVTGNLPIAVLEGKEPSEEAVGRYAKAAEELVLAGNAILEEIQ